MEKYVIDTSIVLDNFEVVGEHSDLKHNTIIEIKCKQYNKIFKSLTLRRLNKC